jgi:hypothetical protein
MFEGFSTHTELIGRPLASVCLVALAEHALGRFLGGIATADQLDAADLAATAGMDLGLDDDLFGAELLGHRAGAFRRSGEAALRHRNAVTREDFLRLVLVQIH